MLELLKEKVFKANLDLVKLGLTIFTWGNVSERDAETGFIVIKPSGIEYDCMTPNDMVVVDIDGNIIEGKCKPSSDTPTHLEIYKKYPSINGIAHTHSTNAVSFAQAGKDIYALGTTHADYFYGNIPCTRSLTRKEVADSYEKNTGLVIIEEIMKRGYDPMSIPAIIVRNHGGFSWGIDSAEAVFNAAVMERVAEMNLKTLALNKRAFIRKDILDKHYLRKHGPNAYYGQKK